MENNVSGLEVGEIGGGELCSNMIVPSETKKKFC